MFFWKQDGIEPGVKGRERGPEPKRAPEQELELEQAFEQEPEWKRQQSRYFAAKVEALQGKARRRYLFPEENTHVKVPPSAGLPGRKVSGGIAGWTALALLALFISWPVSRLLFADPSRLSVVRTDEVIFWYQVEPGVAEEIIKVLQNSNGTLRQQVKPVPVQALGQALAASIKDSRRDKGDKGGIRAGQSPDLVLLDPFSASYFYYHQAFLPLETLVKRDHLADPNLFTPLPLIAGRYVLAIPKTARNPEAAWDLMKYLVKRLPRQIPPLLD